MESFMYKLGQHWAKAKWYQKSLYIFIAFVLALNIFGNKKGVGESTSSYKKEIVRQYDASKSKKTTATELYQAFESAITTPVTSGLPDEK